MKKEDATKREYLDWQMHWEDGQGDVLTGTRIVTEMICKDFNVFIGPEAKICKTQATVAWSRNIPMISYVSVSVFDSNISYFSFFLLKNDSKFVS